MAAPVPVVILTGFLGAGKTTFLNRLLRDPSMANAAVIVNEFGDIPIDHLLVESSDDGIVELASGCVCCTLRGELVETLERLFERAAAVPGKSFGAIMIETTGLADPLPVMRAVMTHPVLKSRLRLGSVVALVDAVNGLETFDRHDVARRQVAVCDLILVSKCDLAGGEIPTALAERLLKLNRNAARMERTGDFAAGSMTAILDPSCEGGALERWYEDLAQTVAEDFGSHGHHGRHGDIRTFTLRRDAPIEKAALAAFVDLLASGHGHALLRMKGLVKVSEHPGRPVLLHGVQTVFHPPRILDKWPDENRQSRLVFISCGLDEEFVERLFDGFCNIPRIDAPDRAALGGNPLAIPGFSGRIAR